MNFASKDYPCQCGSTARWTDEVGQQLIKGGVVPEGARFAFEIKDFKLRKAGEQLHPGQHFYAIVALWDYCLECGRYYCFHVESTEGKMPEVMKVKPEKLSPFPPGYGFPRNPPGFGTPFMRG